MSPDTRRRVMMAVIVLIVVAFVLSTAACTSTTDENGQRAADDSDVLDASLYVEVMNDICADTAEQIAEIPAQPVPATTQSAASWSRAVAAILAQEALAFDAVVVGQDDSDHRSFVLGSELLADEWATLADRLGDGSDDIGAITTEIGRLSLGRDEVATTMGLSVCADREIAS